MIKNVQYTLTISALLPIGNFLCLIGILVIYWCDKWLILRRMVCKNYLGQKLAKNMLKKLKESTFFFACGIILTKAYFLQKYFLWYKMKKIIKSNITQTKY